MTVFEPVPPATRSWTRGRTAALVASTFGLFAAAAIIIGALVLLGAHAFLRDDDGYYSSPTERFTTATHALTAEGLELWNVAAGGGGWLAERTAGSIRFRVEGNGDEPVFAGIAAERDLDRWLGGVAHDEITDVRFLPFSFDAIGQDGTSAPGRPGAQRFWEASTAGTGPQSLEWEPRDGRWSFVIMNADGRADVDAEVSVGITTGLVLPLGLGLLGAGLSLIAAAGVGLRLSLRERT